jgi:hypothetical protein
MRRVRRTKQEVADIVEDFVEGTGGPWDWDDFMSFAIEDPALDEIRERWAQLPDIYPAERGYCSAEGVEVMRSIVKQLRS